MTASIQFDPNHLKAMQILTNTLKKQQPELSLYWERVDALLHDWEELLRTLDEVTDRQPKVQ